VLSRWGGSKFASRSKRSARANFSSNAVKHATEADRLMRLIDNRRQEAETNARRVFAGTGLPQQRT
jgi:hypothetical protein